MATALRHKDTAKAYDSIFNNKMMYTGFFHYFEKKKIYIKLLLHRTRVDQENLFHLIGAPVTEI